MNLESSQKVKLSPAKFVILKFLISEFRFFIARFKKKKTLTKIPFFFGLTPARARLTLSEASPALRPASRPSSPSLSPHRHTRVRLLTSDDRLSGERDEACSSRRAPDVEKALPGAGDDGVGGDSGGQGSGGRSVARETMTPALKFFFSFHSNRPIDLFKNEIRHLLQKAPSSF